MNFLTLKPPFDTLWNGRDAFAAARRLADDAPPQTLARNVEGRRTLRFEQDGRAYYLKCQTGVGWGRIVEDLLHLRLPVLGAYNEWRAIETFHRHGIPTMAAFACGERGNGPARRESFLVTGAIEPAVDLDTFSRNWREEPPSVPLKRALIRNVAEITRRMHEAGLNHRDYYLGHLLLRLDTPPTPENLQLAVIDLHRVQIRKRTPPRWRFKDLAALYFSVLHLDLSKRDRLRFLTAYFSGKLGDILRDRAAWLAALEKEAERLRLRYQRKFADRPIQQR